MSELSPPARAVLSAYRADWRDEQLKQDVKCLAAALRAVADTKATEVSVEGHCRTIVDVDDIHAIADELEAQ